MIKKYIVELEGQREFYESYLKLIDNSLSVDEVLSDNTDGVLNGNLLEFKLNINDLNSVLFQTIKYLSAFRLRKGRTHDRRICRKVSRRHRTDIFMQKDIGILLHSALRRRAGAERFLQIRQNLQAYARRDRRDKTDSVAKNGMSGASVFAGRR